MVTVVLLEAGEERLGVARGVGVAFIASENTSDERRRKSGQGGGEGLIRSVDPGLSTPQGSRLVFVRGKVEAGLLIAVKLCCQRPQVARKMVCCRGSAYLM